MKSRFAHSQPAGQADERGATLFMIGAVMFVLLAIGGIGMDLSMKANRGQDLQGAVDAAALVGAQKWNSTLDTTQTHAVVGEMLTQNGFGSEVQYSIAYDSTSVITVTLSDPSFNGFFSGFFGGLGGIERQATARQNVCVVGCNQVIEAPRILYPIRAIGSGDGFLPIEVKDPTGGDNDKYFSINHHSNTVSCVEKVSGDSCFTATATWAFNSSIPGSTKDWKIDEAILTNGTHHPALIGTKIYFSGSQSPVGWESNYDESEDDLYLTCFETGTTPPQPCSGHVNLGKVGRAAMAAVNDKIYLITSSRKVFCYETDLTECSGYSSSGRDSALSGKSNWKLDEASSWGSDVRVHNGKIYSTHFGKGKTWVTCWNTAASGSVCSDFGSNGFKRVPNGNNAFGRNNRLLLSRDTAGTPTGICVFGRDGVPCWSFTGNAFTVTGLETLRAHMLVARDFINKPADGNSTVTGQGWGHNGWSGMNSYHADSNREFTVNAEASITFCYDYTLADVCKDVNNLPAWRQTAITLSGVTRQARTYGYIGDGNCLVGLGDSSVFHTMKPDLSGPCDSSGGFAEITPCNCAGGQVVWPEIEAVDTTSVTNFRVRVEDPSGNPQWPSDTDADVWHDLLAGPMDLSSVGTFPKLILHFDIVVDQTLDNPWDLGQPPTFIVNGETIPPYLVG